MRFFLVIFLLTFSISSAQMPDIKQPVINAMKDVDQDQVVHNAMAILYFDAFQKVYKMDSHLASGLQANAGFVVLKTGEKFQWSFDTPMGKIRYTIEISDKGTQWFEIGEFSQDGSNWVKTFEMNLTKD